MGTKQNPGNFDCYANAKEDEPMFVLLARDWTAPSAVRNWAERYINRKTLAAQFGPEEQRKHAEALQCADEMEAWHAEHPEV